MHKLGVFALSGSLRTDSFNRKALQIAKRFAEGWGAEVREIDLRELALPIYDADIEAKGFPESVNQFKKAIEAADVILIASPEYNHSIPGGLKNAIDWASRGENSFDGKVAAIFGASNGLFGTARMQPQLRQTLAALNVFVIPQPQIMIRNGGEAFNPDGSLKDEKTAALIKKLVERALETATKLKT